MAESGCRLRGTRQWTRQSGLLASQDLLGNQERKATPRPVELFPAPTGPVMTVRRGSPDRICGSAYSTGPSGRPGVQVFSIPLKFYRWEIYKGIAAPCHRGQPGRACHRVVYAISSMFASIYWLIEDRAATPSAKADRGVRGVEGLHHARRTRPLPTAGRKRCSCPGDQGKSGRGPSHLRCYLACHSLPPPGCSVNFSNALRNSALFLAATALHPGSDGPSNRSG